MTIEDLNALDREEFIRAAGWFFEDSPWVAERAWTRRPFASVDELHRALVEQVEAASPQERLALLRAHPDVGTRAHVSDASAAEQAGAGLDSLTPREFEQLRSLNTAYRAKNGFPFLFAVKGSTKHDIFNALRERSERAPEEEFPQALRQVYRIARFRIEDSIS